MSTRSGAIWQTARAGVWWSGDGGLADDEAAAPALLIEARRGDRRRRFVGCVNEAVADAGISADVSRRRRVVAELRAELVDVRTEVLRVLRVFVAPDAALNHRMRENAPGIRGEVL